MRDFMLNLKESAWANRRPLMVAIVIQAAMLLGLALITSARVNLKMGPESGRGGAYWEADSTGIKTKEWVSHVFMGGTHFVKPETLGTPGTDISAAVQALVDATPPGGRIVFTSDASVLRFSGIARSGSSIAIDLGGNTIQPVANERIFEFEGGFSNIKSVTSLSFISALGTSKTILNMPDTSGYTVGDVVKVVSVDLNPHRWVDSGTFLGEYGIIESINENVSVTLQAKLFDHSLYATNIQVAVLDDVTFEIKNGNIINEPTNSTGGIITFLNARECHVEDLTANNLSNSFFKAVSLYKYNARNITVHNFLNDPANNKYGYGIEDSGSYGGRVESPEGINCRHVVTTNSFRSSGGIDFRTGRTMFLHVTKGIGRNVGLDSIGAGAWDTHTEAVYTTFENCKVYGGDLFAQSRSLFTRYINPVGYDLYNGIKFGTPKWDVQSLLKNAVINPELHVSNILFQCYISSGGTTDPASIAPAQITVIGGDCEIIDSTERGFLLHSRGAPSIFKMYGTKIIVRNVAASPLIFLYANAVSEAEVNGALIDLYGINQTWQSGNPALYFVQYDGAAEGLASSTVLNTIFMGTGTQQLRRIIDSGDGVVHGIKSEFVHSNGLTEVSGTSLLWAF
jgi:hypothetical protein